MSSESPRVRSFLFFVWLLGVAALLATLLSPPVPGESFAPLPVLGAALLAAFAGTRKVYLLRSKQPEESRYVTLGFLVTFGTLLAMGIRAGVLAGIVSSLAADLYPRRNAMRHLLFNVASVTTTAWCSGKVFVFLNHRVGTVEPSSFLAVLAAIITYFCLNAGSLAYIIALIARQPPLSVFRSQFFRTIPLHLSGAAYVALAIMFSHDSRILLMGAFLVPSTLQYYKLYADNAQQSQQIIDMLETGKAEMGELYLSTVKSLATAIAAKDQYTHAHIHRVQRYAVAIAEKMRVTGAELEAVRTGAVLHDIGKLGVPDYVLLKPGRLTPDEFEKMKRHPDIGADILEPVKFPWPVAGVVRHHHERWDGKGYPDGLAGASIPLSARILSVADVYDALTSDRPYRPAWSRQKTQEFLRAEAGTQFDPTVVNAFLEIVDEADRAMQELEGDGASAQAEMGQPSAASTASGASRQIGRSASELWVFYEVSQALNSPAPMQQRLTLLGQKLTAIMQGTTCAFLLYDAPDIAASTAQFRGDFTPPLDGPAFTPSAHAPVNGDMRVGGHGLQGIHNEQAVSLQADKTISVLSGKGERELQVYAAAGLNADVLLTHSHLDAGSPSSVAARERRTYRGAYVEEGLSWSLSAGETRPIKSLLAVPLVHGETGLGAMAFYHRQAEAFSTDDEHLLTMIAEQVQAALHQEQEYVRTYSDANTDALTGLRNMRYLRQKIGAQPLNATPGCALLYLDLDNFKNVNTRYGHPQGSRVLRDIAQLLPRELRPTDMAARYGGDEFVIVLPQTEEAGAREVAARIRAAVQNYRPEFLPDFDDSCRLDVSIGIACAPHDCDCIEELVALADRRMYHAKTSQKPTDDMACAEVRRLLPTPLCLETAVVANVLERLGSRS